MKKTATDEARMAFSSTLITGRDSTIKESKISCNDETYEIPDNLEQATGNGSRYQTNPITIMQSNPAYRISLCTDEIYESVK